jgi:transcriptional antiterminator NusG
LPAATPSGESAAGEPTATGESGQLEESSEAAESNEAAESSEDEESDEEEPEIDLSSVKPLEFIDETVADEDLKFDWFILKVQVNREDSIKDALWRRVKMNGLERFFKEIVVPTEDVVEFTKTGKKRVVKRKLYPGYILINMAVNDESWFIVRETTGIGDFTGSAGKPTPMEPKDVERILRSSKVLPEEEGTGVKTTIPFKNGDRVRVKEGYFQNFEGEVHAIDQTHGRVTVMINIFGRATPVEIEHWQIEAV